MKFVLMLNKMIEAIKTFDKLERLENMDRSRQKLTNTLQRFSKTGNKEVEVLYAIKRNRLDP